MAAQQAAQQAAARNRSTLMISQSATAELMEFCTRLTAVCSLG